VQLKKYRSNTISEHYLINIVHKIVNCVSRAHALLIGSAFVRHLHDSSTQTLLAVSMVEFEALFARLPSGLLKEYIATLKAPFSTRDSPFHSQDGNKAV
jgi:hypothetical protein